MLDIGSGSGRHCSYAYKIKKAFLVASDIKIKDLLKAKERLKYQEKLGEHKGGQWSLTLSDIIKLPFKNESFDCIICSEVMEHIKENKIAASEIIRVLKNSGDLAVSVPRFWPEKICWKLSKDYRNGEHVRIYRKKEIISIFEKAGLKLKFVHFAHGLHTPYWWLRCLKNNQEWGLSSIYHRFLVWDIMKKPRLTRFIEKLINPLLGKSTVLYFKKPQKLITS